MKNTFIKILSVALFIGSFSQLNGSDRYFFISVDANTNNEKIVVDLSSLAGSDVSCQILNEEGIVVYVDDFRIQRSGLKSYNLENLESGQYTFILNDIRQTLEYDVVKEDYNVAIQDSPEVTFKPTITSSNKNIADFHLLSLGKNVILKLNNSEGKEIFKQSYEGTNTISKRFNMTNSPRGEYTLTVRVGDVIYYEYINV